MRHCIDIEAVSGHTEAQQNTTFAVSEVSVAEMQANCDPVFQTKKIHTDTGSVLAAVSVDNGGVTLVNSIRYIITRSCLQEGTMRLLKYNERHFPQEGPAQFVDGQGREWAVQVDRERMRVSGLHGFYRDHNLGVNDVMLLTLLGPGRYQVESVVKPHAAPAPARPFERPSEVERVVVSSTPHVREVRLKRTGSTEPAAPAPTAATPQDSRPAEPVAAPAEGATRSEGARTEAARPDTARAAQEQSRAVTAPQIPSAQTLPAQAPSAPQPAAQAPALPTRLEDQVAELARLTGYALDHPASGLMRLRAELGPVHGYSVLLAADPLAMSQPAWTTAQDESRLLITHESERPEGQPRLTREALVALIEHARLTPLSPIDLRGYWRAGNLDLDSAASISELVSAHLAQRGAFSFVLLSLAGQPAHSIVNVSDLAARLGSGVNTAELNTILDTLARPPFSALTPLQGGQFLLRAGMADLLGDLADYAQGVRRRIKGPAQAAQPTGQTTAQRRGETVPV